MTSKDVFQLIKTLDDNQRKISELCESSARMNERNRNELLRLKYFLFVNSASIVLLGISVILLTL